MFLDMHRAVTAPSRFSVEIYCVDRSRHREVDLELSASSSRAPKCRVRERALSSKWKGNSGRFQWVDDFFHRLPPIPWSHARNLQVCVAGIRAPGICRLLPSICIGLHSRRNETAEPKLG